MTSSVLSKNKDVAAIVPAKNLNAASLEKMTWDVLNLLHKTWFVVLGVISDNNSVNRNAFTSMCGGVLKTHILNPYCANEPLFFLFDTVHLFKCVRNNWLNQQDSEKTFIFPQFPHDADSSVVVDVSFPFVQPQSLDIPLPNPPPSTHCLPGSSVAGPSSAEGPSLRSQSSSSVQLFNPLSSLHALSSPPDPSSSVTPTLKASFSHLRNLYSDEKIYF